MRRREAEVKKDIWAAITFLTTGALFYLAQADVAPQKVFSSSGECGAVETIMATKNVPETLEAVPLPILRTRDS